MLLNPFKKKQLESYFAIVTCRNSQDTINDVLLSLKNQTIPPEYVIVIDDGSTDKKQEVLKDLQKEWTSLYIITNSDSGHDLGRAVRNWNKALNLVKELNLNKTDFHMIATDDTIYEIKYAEKLLSYLAKNQDIGIISGNYDDEEYFIPRGCGRLVRNSFFEKCGLNYPEKMGNESSILCMAMQNGYTYEVLSKARLEHARKP